MDDVKKVGQWSQAYNSTINYIMELFLNEHLENAILAFETDDDALLKSSARAYSDYRRELLDGMPNVKASIPPVPDLASLGTKGKKLADALRVQFRQLDVIIDEAAEASGYMDTWIARLSKGDESGVDEIYRQQNLAAIRLLEAENVQVDAALLAIPEDNPNHAFQTIVQAVNIFSIEELKLDNASIDAALTLDDRRDANRIMKQQLDVISQQLSNGRIMSKNLAKKLGTIKESLPDDHQKNFMQKVITAMATFDPQFDVEQQMYDMLLKSYGLYTSEQNSDEYEAELSAHDNEIISLNIERGEIMMKRADILAG